MKLSSQQLQELIKEEFESIRLQEEANIRAFIRQEIRQLLEADNLTTGPSQTSNSGAQMGAAAKAAAELILTKLPQTISRKISMVGSKPVDVEAIINAILSKTGKALTSDAAARALKKTKDDLEKKSKEVKSGQTQAGTSSSQQGTTSGTTSGTKSGTQ